MVAFLFFGHFVLKFWTFCFGDYNRIKNLLRNREFSSLENKAEIMREIEGVTKLIYNYLYQNRIRDE